VKIAEREKDAPRKTRLKKGAQALGIETIRFRKISDAAVSFWIAAPEGWEQRPNVGRQARAHAVCPRAACGVDRDVPGGKA
jgi:hypothetical protein